MVRPELQERDVALAHMRMQGGDQDRLFATVVLWDPIHAVCGRMRWGILKKSRREKEEEQGDPPHANVVLFGRAPSIGGHPEKTS